MGFNLNKAKAAKEEILKSFTPLELNEGNVQAIFNRCLATKDTPNADVQLTILFEKVMGYDEDSKPMAFRKSTVEQNKKNVLYLMGQLNSVHQGSRAITAKESIYRYDGKKWTTETVTIMQLYHLAKTADCMAPFVKQSNRAMTEPIVTPTLSPKDPEFPAWWEAHKSEWEDKA
ncbi:hypothetical protein [Subdoligranulum variabile]|uniref:Uncharacterized protein n=1 Tax=Subdoligranulum variabile DSM 15176 TaxID=411471 RepID=D1PQK8_9FIRM|nr:hypothetical protein [Subdoligranulum variabile]EFB74988.1 hypothetical protein SUBVAR_06677 [Subdoligranulum variabile DSM 15176]UWP69723.1 hypothetical protein NQ490_07750 [Subdoligranulum variabile]